MLKAGIIGCGAIAPIHANAIKDSKRGQLTAVCDIDKARAKAMAERYGCKAFTDYKEMLDEVDVVHLCLPHYLHAPVAIDCLKAGRGVLTEKPMAIEYEDALAMVKASEESGSPLHVIFQNRFNDGSVAAKKFIDDKELLGEVVSARAFVTWKRCADYYTSCEWKGTWDKEGGGVIINQAIHTLDLMRWLVGSDIKNIDVSMANRTLPEIEVEDTAEGMITFENGVRGLFYATNCYGSDAPILLEILCEKGTVVLKAADMKIILDDGRVVHCEQENGRNGIEGKSYWGNSHKEQIEDFYKSIETGSEVFIPVSDVLKTQKMICNIYEKGKKTL